MPYKKLYSTPEYTPIEISTDAEMAAVLLDDTNLGKVYKFIGTSGTYINGDLYETEYYIDPRTIPLCFTANAAGSTVTLNKNGNPGWTGSYSTDNIVWNTYTPGTTGAITLTNVGDKVYFKGDISGTSFNTSNYLQFSMTGSIAASGNVNSLHTSTNFEELVSLIYYCYYNLFYNCSSLTVAPLLPATTVETSCYQYMFRGCVSLTLPPELPATTLSSSCYQSMFEGCSSLTSAPQLPATAISYYCYYRMFMNCTSLVTVPKLPATTLFSYYCYGYMFNGCTSLQVSDTQTTEAPNGWMIPDSGTFTNSYSQHMFVGCAGTRASDDMAGEAGQSYTYYTQNPPV